MIAFPVAGVFTGQTFEWLAQAVTAIVLWSQTRTKAQGDPLEELTYRLRHPVKAALRSPLATIRRKVTR